MRTTALLTNNDARRRSAVEFIQNTYAARYNARLEVFPSRIITLLDDCEDILCAAGLRFLDDGFFSERYLDVPIGDVVGAISARTVNRDAIFATTEFIAEIGAFGEKAGFEWSFFILTRRLHIMICRLGITPTFLGEADRLRIADAEPWGTYYACQPKVYAVASRRLKMGCDGFQRGVRNAATV
jgi:Thermostable hemolysin